MPQNSAKTPERRARWEKIRAKGIKRYAWTRGVLGIGVPLVLATLLMGLLGPNRENRAQLWGSLATFLVIWPLSGYYLAIYQWHENEKACQREGE